MREGQRVLILRIIRIAALKIRHPQKRSKELIVALFVGRITLFCIICQHPFNHYFDINFLCPFFTKNLLDFRDSSSLSIGLDNTLVFDVKSYTIYRIVIKTLLGRINMDLLIGELPGFILLDLEQWLQKVPYWSILRFILRLLVLILEREYILLRASMVLVLLSEREHALRVRPIVRELLFTHGTRLLVLRAQSHLV